MINCIEIIENETATTVAACAPWLTNDVDIAHNARFPDFTFEVTPQIPQSFWRGLCDCEEGRHYDMEHVLQAPPAVS